MASIAKLASHLGLSVTRTNLLIANGVITKQGPGQYDLDVCRASYIEHLRNAASGKNNEKERLDKVRADKVEMENDVARGTLVPAALVETQWSRIAHEIQTKLGGLPLKLAPQILLLKEPLEIEEAIRTALDEALAALRDTSLDVEEDSEDS